MSQSIEMQMPKLSVEHIALGMYWAWLWVFYESAVVLDAVGGFGWMDVAALRVTGLASMTVFLVIGAFFSRAWRGRDAVVILSFIAMAAGPAGIAVLWAFPQEFASSVALVFVGCADAALAFLWARYIMRFSRYRFYQAYCVAISVVFGGGLFFLVHIIVTPMVPIVVGLLPVGAGLVFLSGRSTFGQDGDGRDETVSPYEASRQMTKESGAKNNIILRICVGLGIYGFSYGILRSLNGYVEQSETNFISMGLFVLAGALLAFYLSKKRLRGLTMVYRLVLPCMVVGLLLIPLYSTRFLDVSIAIADTGYLLFESLIWIILFDAIARLNLKPIQAFGLGRAMTVLGMTLGLFLTSQAIERVGTLDVHSLMVPFILLGIVVLVLTNTYILNEKEIITAELTDVDEETQDRLAHTSIAVNEGLDDVCKGIALRKSLTEREAEVLAMLARGKTISQISEELFISKYTAKTHTYNLYKKLNVHSRAELIAGVQGGGL